MLIWGWVLGNMIVVIIGIGCIGLVIVKIFKGFGCCVIGYDIYYNLMVDGIFEYVNLVEEVVEKVDFVFLYMLLIVENMYLFNLDMFK